jgi:hypothetical protein
MKDACFRLRTATRRAKSDVANKLVSMFLHELSRLVSQNWAMSVDSEEYAIVVRRFFGNRCPYCSLELGSSDAVVEHLDGMNRYRAGLHVPGNVLVACRRCNSEKRRDDSQKSLRLATTGWESFLSHDGVTCASGCQTCRYWKSIWPEDFQRSSNLLENRERIQLFRKEFAELHAVLQSLAESLPLMLPKLYSDCQEFAEREIKALLDTFANTLRALEAQVKTK